MNYIKPGDIAKELSIPRATIYKWIHQGVIPGGFNFAPGTNTGLRVLRADYEAWRDRCKLTARGPKTKEDPCPRE